MPLKRRRRSDPIPDVHIVETADGARLRCTVSSIGRATEPRWIVIDAKGEQFVGPVVAPDHSPEAVKRLIEEWWSQLKAGTQPRP